MVDDEESLRANWYALLGSLLAREPSVAALSDLAGFTADDSPLGTAIGDMARLAQETPADAVRDEYFQLFIGVSGGDLNPYASYYLTGFLYERPLAKLRGHMQRLGIERAPDVAEPEDHIASLCEMMAGLILGQFGLSEEAGSPQALAEQKQFFTAHLAPWADRFFDDLERAPNARFYRPVGTIGRLFFEIEADAFKLLPDPVAA